MSKFERANIEKIKGKNITKKTQKKWAETMVLFTVNDDEELRFCMNYLILNPVTEQDAYSTSNMQECIESLGTVTFILAMDVKSGYRNIDSKDPDNDKEDFASIHGLYQLI